MVVAGAEAFLHGVLAAARRFGVSAFVVTFVLSGLEVENLAAGIAANAKGLGGAAAGTFLGGSTFLALGVAGLAAAIRPVEAVLRPRTLLVTALAALPLGGLALDRQLSRIDGGVLLAWFVVALVIVARDARGVTEEPTAATAATVGMRRFWPVRLIGGLVLLGLGGEVLGEAIRRVVSRFGISSTASTALGNTVIAASVEAEEVGRVVIPNKRGRGDLAVANIAGTIVHFVTFNAGVIALVRPIELDDATVYLHLPVAVVAPVALAAVLRIRGGLRRGDGAFLAACYAAYVTATIFSVVSNPLSGG